jgi:hypothetical protein
MQTFGFKEKEEGKRTIREVFEFIFTARKGLEEESEKYIQKSLEKMKVEAEAEKN